MSPIPLSYNTKVKFAKGEVLQFPDFSLEFLGERPFPPSPAHVPSGPRQEFRVTCKGQSQTVFWFSGTGDISPKIFKTTRRKEFGLELSISDKLGQLAPNELVISTERTLPEYRRPIRFAEGQILEFPDFDLVLTGSRIGEILYSPEQIEMLTNSNLPLGAGIQKVTVYDFEATKDGQRQKVVYSAASHPLKFYIPWGTTRRPAVIEIGLSHYVNEDGSPINLNPGELVVTLFPPLPLKEGAHDKKKGHTPNANP